MLVDRHVLGRCQDGVNPLLDIFVPQVAGLERLLNALVEIIRGESPQRIARECDNKAVNPSFF
ncbi:MAG: hypothetical protein ACJARS_004429 [bacterium]